MRQRTLGDLFTIDVGPVAGALVADHDFVALGDDVGVVPGHFAAGEPEIVGFAAADAEQRLIDGDDAAAEGVGDFEAGGRHQRRLIMRMMKITSAAPASRPATVW